MIRHSLIGLGVCLVLATGTGRAAEDPPRILATMPTSGSDRVPARLKAILVTFDRDMEQGSHSLVGAEGGEVPPLGDDPTWVNARTLVIPLGGLTAGRSYALGLNSEKHHGFRTVEGTPLQPAAVRFSTAGPGETARPVVVDIEPDFGAVDVDPGIGEILVTFSEDVRKGGMSLLRMAGAEVLGYVRETPPYLKSPRVLAIPVRLRPETLYGAFVNGPGKKGFVADDTGEVFLPAPIVFSTGKARAATPGTGLAGRWTANEGGARIVIELDASGRYAYEASYEGETDTARGTYRREAEVLVFTEDGGATPLRVPFRHPDEGVLEVQLEGSWIRLVREGGSSAPAPAPAASGLAGVWEWSDGARALRITFGAGGDYEYWSRIDGQENSSRGRWRDLGKVIQITTEDGSDMRLPYRLLDANTLEISLGSGSPVRFARGGGAGPAPPTPAPKPALPGTWHWCGESSEIRIVLRADGRYTYQTREGNETEASEGRWRDLGGTLEIQEDGVDEPLSVPYRFVDGRLEIDLGGERIALGRED